MTEHQKNLLATYNDLLTFALKVGIGFGFIIFASYLLLNSVFPWGLTVGDGILFITILLVFSGVHVLFVASITALGQFYAGALQALNAIRLVVFSSNLGWSEAKQRLRKPVNIIDGYLFPTIVFACFGLFIEYLFLKQAYVTGDVKTGALALIVPTFCGFLWQSFPDVRDRIIQLEGMQKLDEEQDRNLQHSKKGRAMIFLSIVFMPIVLGLGTNNLLNSTMERVNIRKPYVSLHVKEPYNAYMVERGYIGEKSDFGEGYKKYKGFTVLLQGMGNVVFARSADGKDEVLEIPQSFVVVVPAIPVEPMAANLPSSS